MTSFFPRPRPLGMPRPSAFGNQDALRQLIGGLPTPGPNTSLLGRLLDPQAQGSIQGVRSLLRPEDTAAVDAGLLTPGEPLRAPGREPTETDLGPTIASVVPAITKAVTRSSRAAKATPDAGTKVGAPSPAAPDLVSPGSSVATGAASSFDQPDELTQNRDEDRAGVGTWIERALLSPLTLVQTALTGNREAGIHGVLGSLGIGPEAAMQRAQIRQDAANAGARKALHERLRILGQQLPDSPEGQKLGATYAALDERLGYGTPGKASTGGQTQAKQAGIGEWVESLFKTRGEREEDWAEEMQPKLAEATFLRAVPGMLGDARTAMGDARQERSMQFEEGLRTRADQRAAAQLALSQAAGARAERAEGRAITAADLAAKKDARAAARQAFQDWRQTAADRRQVIADRLKQIGVKQGALRELRLAADTGDAALIKANLSGLGAGGAFQADSSWWPGSQPGVDYAKIPDFGAGKSELEAELEQLDALLMRAGNAALGVPSGGDDTEAAPQTEESPEQMAQTMAANGASKDEIVAALQARFGKKGK